MKSASSNKSKVEAIAKFRDQTQEAAARYLVGYEPVIDDILISFLAQGHIILVGLPGLGKTLMVKVLSKIWGLEFNRVQFTPDLLPSDITGTEIIQEKAGKGSQVTRSFEFQKGPVFTNLLLADEINRTPPKTQSSLLQAMEERQVTVGRKTMDLPAPFMVMATQNPIEMEGTYPLPEAQLDRFFMSINLQYPTEEDELKIALINKSDQNFDKLKPLANAKVLMQWSQLIQDVLIPESVTRKIVTSVRNTRPGSGNEMAERYGEYGAGPRAVQYLVQAARAKALLLGKTAVTEELVDDVFLNIMRHRILLNYIALAEKISVDDYLKQCLVD